MSQLFCAVYHLPFIIFLLNFPLYCLFDIICHAERGKNKRRSRISAVCGVCWNRLFNGATFENKSSPETPTFSFVFCFFFVQARCVHKYVNKDGLSILSNHRLSFLSLWKYLISGFQDRSRNTKDPPVIVGLFLYFSDSL